MRLVSEDSLEMMGGGGGGGKKRSNEVSAGGGDGFFSEILFYQMKIKFILKIKLNNN